MAIPHLTGGPILGRLHGIEHRLLALRDDQRVFHLGLAAFLLRHGLHEPDDLALHSASAALLQRLDAIRGQVADIRFHLMPGGPL